MKSKEEEKVLSLWPRSWLLGRVVRTATVSKKKQGAGKTAGWGGVGCFSPLHFTWSRGKVFCKDKVRLHFPSRHSKQQQNKQTGVSLPAGDSSLQADPVTVPPGSGSKHTSGIPAAEEGQGSQSGGGRGCTREGGRRLWAKTSPVPPPLVLPHLNPGLTYYQSLRKLLAALAVATKGFSLTHTNTHTPPSLLQQTLLHSPSLRKQRPTRSSNTKVPPRKPTQMTGPVAPRTDCQQSNGHLSSPRLPYPAPSSEEPNSLHS